MSDEPVTITAYPDGPLLVRGAAELRTADGREVSRTRRTVALCRCGLSTIKPFCEHNRRCVNLRDLRSSVCR